MCLEYMLHIYGHVLDDDPEFLDMRDHQDQDLTFALRVRDNCIFNKYEDDIARLKGSIKALEQELGHTRDLLEEQQSKKTHTHEPSPPSENSQRICMQLQPPGLQHHVLHPSQFRMQMSK